MHTAGGGSGPSELTVFWRPACGFCASLRRQLESSGLRYVEVNIWDEPDAAATVRSYAGGNETVPMVVVGRVGDEAAVGLVNPTVDQVVRTIERHAPHLLDEPAPGSGTPDSAAPDSTAPDGTAPGR